VAWDFETDPAFQYALDWIERFMRDHVEPLDHSRPLRQRFTEDVESSEASFR
jgi:hypothetical protein